MFGSLTARRSVVSSVKFSRLYRHSEYTSSSADSGISRVLIRDVTQPTVDTFRPLEIVEDPFRAIQGRRRHVACLGLDAGAL